MTHSVANGFSIARDNTSISSCACPAVMEITSRCFSPLPAGSVGDVLAATRRREQVLAMTEGGSGWTFRLCPRAAPVIQNN